MKKKVLTIIITVLLLLVMPLSVIVAGFATPPQFDETYYGELSHMFHRLKSAQGKKIVLIGNSGLAFGVRTDLLESELPEYEVVNFGLYGAIGTRAMLDLAKVNISVGDIVIVALERTDQSQSLTFSAENMWMALDGNYSMLKYISPDNRSSMVGGFTKFASRKFGYLKDGKPSVDGVYAQDSFNDESGREVGYMTYDRPYNVMSGGYDVNNLIDFSGDVSDGFIDYLNEFNKFVTKKGARLYYGFAPVNGAGLKAGTKEDDIESYYNRLYKKLDFGFIGDPNNYIFDYKWFYDTNFHVNSAGMYVYTDRLAEDIKAELGITSESNIEIPDPPEPPIVRPSDGDNTDADCFTYEDYSDGVRITCMTENGKGRTSYTIPATYDGKAVLCFSADVFKNNETVREIILQSNIRVLYDESFEGCASLSRLVLYHKNPNTLGVGVNLMNGAGNCKIYVYADVYDLFATHYNWGAYRDIMIKMN